MGYELIDIEVGHVQIQRYRRYQYPTMMIWRQIHPAANPQDLLKGLGEHLGANRTIWTSYGNPYDCNFGRLELVSESQGTVQIEATGTCVRT